MLPILIWRFEFFYLLAYYPPMAFEVIISAILRHYPRVQGVYIFGAFATAMERSDSDLDIALLLPPAEARKEKPFALSACRNELESLTKRSVDLINLREINTVFQNEIIAEGRLIYVADEAQIDTFEMNVLSAYQKLNEERADILKEIEASGRVLR
jgi:predicted nucleotidyltransferase